MVAYTKQNLDAFVFGDCPDTQQVDNFAIFCNHGLLFTSDHGKASSGIIINHGSDASNVGLSIDAVGPAGLQLINTQLVSRAAQAGTSLEITNDTAGRVDMLNGFTWGRADLPTMMLHGAGTTIVVIGAACCKTRISQAALMRFSAVRGQILRLSRLFATGRPRPSRPSEIRAAMPRSCSTSPTTTVAADNASVAPPARSESN